MEKQIEQAINDSKDVMTKGQRMLGEFILAHLDKVAFMSSFELAAACGASQASVIRFASAIGYEGFRQMQDCLHLELKRRFSPLEQLGSFEAFKNSEDALKSISAWDSANIRKTTAHNSGALLEKACKGLQSAAGVFIYGAGQISPAAVYLASCLRNGHKNVCCINQLGEEPLDAVLNISHADALVVISMPLHSQSTAELCAHARSRGAYVLLICDFEQSMLCDFASDKLGCVCGELGINGTMAPLISLCGTIGCLMLKN